MLFELWCIAVNSDCREFMRPRPYPYWKTDPIKIKSLWYENKPWSGMLYIKTYLSYCQTQQQKSEKFSFRKKNVDFILSWDPQISNYFIYNNQSYADLTCLTHFQSLNLILAIKSVWWCMSCLSKSPIYTVSKIND